MTLLSKTIAQKGLCSYASESLVASKFFLSTFGFIQWRQNLSRPFNPINIGPRISALASLNPNSFRR